MERKPKRGVDEFIHIHTGKKLWFYRQVSPSVYCCSDSPDHSSIDTYNKEDLKPVKELRTPIQSKAKPQSKEDIKFKQDLNVFFASQILTMPKNCENCGKPLEAFTHLDRRSVIAHILPKSNKQSLGFPEIALNPNNRMFLGAKCGCHHKWDTSTAVERSKMRCYDIAIERFNTFKHLIPDNKLPKAYTYLNISII